MKKYIIIATLVLYTMTNAMDTETLDFVINKLDASMYRSTKNVQPKDDIRLIIPDENGKAVLEAYYKTRSTQKFTHKFTMARVSNNILWQAKL